MSLSFLLPSGGMNLRRCLNSWFWLVGFGVSLLSVIIPPLLLGLYSWISKVLDTQLETCLESAFPLHSGYGLVSIEPFASTWTGEGIDLVFVHGLDSNPETAWEKKNSSYVCATSLCAPSLGKEKVNWVLDLLPEDLPDPVRHRTRAFFYNYNYCGQRRRANAVDLLDNLMSLIEINPHRTFIFIAHSYGGLVIKEALIQSCLAAHVSKPKSLISLIQKTEAIVFLGTPHRGFNWGWLGTRAHIVLHLFGRAADVALIKATQYDSLELLDMHRDFEKVSSGIEILNFYEKQKTTRLNVRDHVVSEQSATLDRPTAENFGLETDHIGLNKFAKRDSNYKIMRRKLIKLMERAAEGMPRP